MTKILVEPSQLAVRIVASSTSGIVTTWVLSVPTEKGSLGRGGFCPGSPGVMACGGSFFPPLESHCHRPKSGLSVTMHEQAMPTFISIMPYKPLSTLSHVLSVANAERLSFSRRKIDTVLALKERGSEEKMRQPPVSLFRYFAPRLTSPRGPKQNREVFVVATK